jgi:hypothetical protein
MIARRSTGVVRWWVGLYTRGLSNDVRDGRREEIEADLWDQLEEATTNGSDDRVTGAEILTRLVLGIPADLTWRMAPWTGQRVRPAAERSATRGTRVLGLLAIVGGLAVTLGAAVFAGVMTAGSSPRPWDGTIDHVQLSIMGGAGTVGMIAIAVATVGLVFNYRHRARRRAVIAASAAAAGAVVGVLGAWPAMCLAPAGFAYFIWDLGRVGVVPRSVAAANVAAGLALLVPIAAVTSNTPVGLAIVLVIPYWITWLAIGGSLVRGMPAIQRA